MSEKFEGATPPQESMETRTESFDGIDIISESEAQQQFPNLFQIEQGKEQEQDDSKLSEDFHWYSGAASVPENVHNVHYFNPKTEAELGQKIIAGARRDCEKVFLYRRANGSVAVVVDTRSKIVKREEGKE